MAGIEEYLQQILAARYGEEVRGSIHDAIQQCYEDGKVGAVDLVARKQIANLVANEGSTDKDSEIVDARVDFLGKTYESLGENIRSTFSDFYEKFQMYFNNYSENILQKMLNSSSHLVEDFTNGFILKDTVIELLISIPTDMVGATVQIGFFKEHSDQSYSQMAIYTLNDTETDIVIEAEDDYVTMNGYFSNYNGEFDIKVTARSYFRKDIERLASGKNVKRIYEKSTQGSFVTSDLNCYNGYGNSFVRQNMTFITTFDNQEFSDNMAQASFRNSDDLETNHQRTILQYPDCPLIITADRSYDEYRLYSPNYSGMVSTKIFNNPFKSVSILGDSYSAFKDFIQPSTNPSYYPNDNNPDVSDYTYSWMYLFSKLANIYIAENNSWSGSTICNNGYNSGSDDAKDFSYIARCKNLKAADIIIIEGGTNDEYVCNSYDGNIGYYKYTNFSDEDLTYFRPSLAYLLNYMTKRFSGSLIIFMLNDKIIYTLKESIETICDYYSVPILYLGDISLVSGHPDKHGHYQIFTKLVSMLADFVGKD